MAEQFEGPVVVNGLIDVRNQGLRPGRVQAAVFAAPPEFGTFKGFLVDVRDVQCKFIRIEAGGDITLENASLREMFDRIRQLEQMVADLQQTVAGLATLSHPQGSG
ncbi:hypothetical protein OG590_39165 (plasmid) [Streptomyces goshikiensis]|uniref:hypothetical protein n=1 Tax=Streptomyces goshikiensis TaxID=1942 RepID=UPI002F90F8CC|nr:hypothetical protein OG590_39165 [Streptomyces goshikiensis]